MSALLKQVIADCHRAEQAASCEPVNHPPHYTRGNIECIDAIKAATEDLNGFEGFCTGNAIKYLWRWKAKGDPVQDLEKAAWYLAALTEYARAERREDGTK